MDAKFFLANSYQGKNPSEAVKLRDNKMAVTRFETLEPYMGASFALPRNYAIIMSGVTDDLKQALQSAIDVGGVKEILVEGLMAIWYVRCRHHLKDITVVSIASLQGYWDLKLNDPDRSSGYNWLRLYTGYTVNGGISLDALANQLVPDVKGKASWKLDDAVVSAEEKFLRSYTPPGLVMSEEGASGRLVGDLDVVLDGAASQATIDKANQFFTDPQARLHTQNGFPTVTEQFWQDRDRCELRVGGDRTSGALINAPGGEDPRVLLRRFAGTDAGALSLSKFMHQMPVVAIIDKGARTAFPGLSNFKFRIPTDRSAAVLPGNAKTFFISVRRTSNSWEFDYVIETSLSGFVVDMTRTVDLDPTKSWLKASMQISISNREFAAGNLTSIITKRPQIAMHTEMTTAALAQQVARGGLQT